MKSRNEKVVYVLGAGFSIPAGAPSQAGILQEIFKLDDQESAKLAKAKREVNRFLIEDLGIKEGDRDRIALEDLYTPIDRCISDGASLKGKSYADLIDLRDKLGYLISRAIESKIKKDGADSTYLDTFAQHLVRQAAYRSELAKGTDSANESKNYDPFSIISLNWDILLDCALQRELLRRDGAYSGDYDPFGVVDYCCYVSSFDSGDRRVRPGLWSLGCRGYNVKLLKPHGSMNWLQCPNCQRIFVSFERKLDILERVGSSNCRHCKKCGHSHNLQMSLVMPTFLKDLNNFQIKLVWQNAGVELLEATRVVFVGYSLPYADFEFRQLLTRMVSREAKIDVVLRENSDEEFGRYKVFFSGREVREYREGTVDYVNKLVTCTDVNGPFSHAAI